MIKFNEYIEIHALLESTDKTAIVSFGRMNGVTKGHLKLMNKLVDLGKEYNATPMLFLSHSTDKRKNPLKYEDKIKIVKSCAPAGLQVVNSQAKNIFDVLKAAAKLGAKHVKVVVGSDRVQEFSRFKKYTEELGLDTIEIVSVGERDPDADDITGMSGTKLRQYAIDGDYESFKKGAATKDERMSKFMYDKIREGLGIKDSKN